MPTNPDSPQSDDLSALAWVQGELRRSLENAHKSLRRYLKEAESIGKSDVDAADPGVLRAARSQLHQGVGALELVGLPGPARVLRAAEAAVQKLLSKPAAVDEAAVQVIERASFALLDYLARVLAGKKMSPVALFPQYRDAQQLAGVDRAHPADLWEQDWRWMDLPVDAAAVPRSADDAARGAMETLVLGLMRQPDAATWVRMSDFCAGLGAGASDSRTATLWKLAAAFSQSQAAGLLTPDLHSKRVASRLLAQLRATVRSQEEPSDRLAQDLLFFCANSRTPSPDSVAPRLAAVRHEWRLDQQQPVDYEIARLGRFDPAWIAQARKRVAGAKDVWSAVAGGELHRLAGLAEQFSLLGDSLQRLFPRGEELSQALQAAATKVLATGDAPDAPLAMEVATGVLYLDAILEDGDLDHPDLPGRISRLAQRIGDVRGGAGAQALEPWMEELYRRVSDRQTMGSVVQELRASLSEVEKQIDQYFRNPVQRELLIPVPNQLSSMRGVLSVLGMDQASAAVLHMRDDVDALASTEVDPQQAIRAGTFDRLADNMGALSFLIDMLSVQPQLAKSLFRYDAQQGTLSAVMGQSERPSVFGGLDEVLAPAAPELVDQTLSLAKTIRQPQSGEDVTQRLEELSEKAEAADQPALLDAIRSAQTELQSAPDEQSRAAVRSDLATKITDIVAQPATAEPSPPPPPVPAPKPAPAGGTGLEDDAEMREVFIEEAREVIEAARGALANLADMPDDLGELTTIRRAFHTLKGSSRMVGLRDYGEAAWACEQLYNARLAQAPKLDPALRDFTGEALGYLAGWTEAEAAGTSAGHSSPPVVHSADALRLQGQRVPIAPPVAAAPAVSLPVLEVPTIPAPPPPVPAAPAAPLPSLDLEELSFDETPTLPLPPRTPEPVSLVSRVPDLPSALDLDLAPVASAPTAPVEEVSFELDLGDGGTADDNVQPFADMPAQPEVAEEIDLDFGVFEAASAPTPAPVAEPPVLSLPTLSEEVADLDLSLPDPATPPTLPVLDAIVESTPESAAPAAEPPWVLTEVVEAANEPLPPPEEPEVLDEQVKVIGPLRIAIPLFNIFLNEADEQSRRLVVELSEWGIEFDRRAVPESTIALAHSLAGNSATVGYAELSELARALEHALIRSRVIGHGSPGEPELFSDAAEDIRRLLHQFAAGFLRSMTPGLLERLAEHERSLAEVVAGKGDQWREASEAEEPTPSVFDTISLQGVATPLAPTFGALDVETAAPAPAGAAVPRTDAFDDDDDIDAEDNIDGELFPIFEEEAEELLPQLQARLREWTMRPSDRSAASACMRTLHTFKGGSRLAGAMRLGEMAHRLETAIERLAAEDDIVAERVERLLGRADAMAAAFDALRKPAAVAAAPVETPAPPAQPVAVSIPVLPLVDVVEAPAVEEAASPVQTAPVAPVAEPAGVHSAFDWSRFSGESVDAARLQERPASSGTAAVRVRSGLLDRLVNQAGEVSITRARIDTDVRLLQSSLNDLTDNLDRLRRQLRDIEVQAESQITSRMEAAKAASQSFDPLEMDRFTRFQELTRMMAESVNDVATVQRTVQRTLQSTEDELASQARLTRELQDDLLRTRMVEFESLADRLYRVVRQAAKDTGKQVRLDIVGGAIEVDRGVLERMVGPFEHLLRNSVAHGVEMPADRVAAGKDATGTITLTVTQEGNEVGVEVRDDGAGLNLERIRQRAEERGLIQAGQGASDAELANLIFAPGFSTASEVTELAGRGVGLDVVRAEVNGMGGRIETGSSTGQGTRFRLLLPLTTAVTQVVMLRCGELRVAVPSTLIEVVRRVPTGDVERAYASGTFPFGDETLPFYWLSALLQGEARGPLAGRSQPVVIVRSAAQRVALHIDEVVGNQEVVVKHVGPQLSRLPGLAGVTLLPSGAIALIYNPVALAALYGESARQRAAEPTAPVRAEVPVEMAVQRAPLVLVVDDSLTVRRVTQRLLTREGYRVTLAKDGMDALERLAEERPVVMLSDIEMPRMDGFDLVRNVRADAKYAKLPVIMITSRIAQKHRDYATELGVEHYLGKPFSEDELLALVSRYAGADIAV